jgi:predicted enzyme involved in methoxymalonyl-ACP biosynthesis
MALTSRGIVLGIVSKNEETSLFLPFDSSRNDFGAKQLCWLEDQLNDKVENVRMLLNELNLGAEAAVFIDDNPV